MAVSWGAWEYGSGNGMRVGVEAHVDAMSHGETVCNISVDYWTDNQYTYNDGQTMNFGGSIGGSSAFTNNDSPTAVKRFTKSYNYTYPASSYGSSPGNRTFSCSISGAYNGVTPSASDTVSLPVRPYAEPAPVTSASLTRVSDETNKISWVNHPTAGEPYSSTTQINRYIYPGTISGYAGQAWNPVAYVSGSATSYSDAGAIPNRKWLYRIYARNSVGTAAYDQTGILYTSPGTPTSCNRYDMGANQRITWVNNVNYDEYAIEVWHAANGVWDATPLITLAAGSGVTEYVHSGPSAAVKHKYKVRAKTTSGTVLYSSYSGETTETAGSTSAPSAPTNLAPATPTIADQGAPIVLTWKHNPTDSSAQTAYSLQHRVAGGSWTVVPKTTSSASNHTIAQGTYANSTQVEWQVQTWGADSAGSPMSAIATFFTSDPVPRRYPMYLDVTSGRVEASSTPVASGGGGIEWGSWNNVTRNTTNWATGSVRYRRSVDGSLVHLDMNDLRLVNEATTTAQGNLSPDINVCTLPAEAFPDTLNVVQFGLFFSGSYVLLAGVGTNGGVSVYSATAASYTVSTVAVASGSVVYGAPSTGGGSLQLAPLVVQEEGSPVMPGTTTLNFLGSAVTATSGAAGVANVTISAGAPAAHTHVEADLPTTMATEAEATTIANTAVSTHAAAADPHTGYQRELEKAAANGYAGLDANIKVPIAQLPTGNTATTVTIGNDARLSDARTPTTHTHAAADVNSGAFLVDRLGSSPAATTYLKGAATGGLAAWATTATLKTDLALTKTDVGLANVDNTSDANKPVSTATTTALAGKANTSHTHVATTDLTATGTKDTTTFLRGDNTWGVPPGIGNITYGAAVAETLFGQAKADGVATSASRSDHTHGTPSLGTTATTAAAGNHGHALTDANITGVLPIAQVPTGTTSTTVALGNHNHDTTYASLTAAQDIAGAKTFTAAVTRFGATGTTQNITLTGGAGNQGIEIGRTDGTASTPFMDFHSGATAVDYDARMIASGGTGTSAGGTLNILAANLQKNGVALPVDTAVVHLTGNETVAGTKTFSSPLGLIELGSTPATPASGVGTLYTKTDGLPYYLGDDGVERQLITPQASALHENPGFEGTWFTSSNGSATVIGPCPPGYSLYWCSNGVTSTQESVDKTEGQYAFRLDKPAGAGINARLHSTTVFPCSPGDIITIAADVKSSVAATAYLGYVTASTQAGCDFFSGDPALASGATNFAMTAGAAYRRCQTTFQVPAGCYWFRFTFHYDTTGNVAGVLRIDNGASTLTASPAAAGGVAWGAWNAVTRNALWSAGTIRYRRSFDGSLVQLDIDGLVIATNSAASQATGNLSPDINICTLPADAIPDGQHMMVLNGFGAFAVFAPITVSGAVTATAVSMANTAISTAHTSYGSVVYATPTTGVATQSAAQHMRRTTNATQSIANGTTTVMTFNTVAETSGGITYANGLFTIAVPGLYVCSFGVPWNENSAGRRTTLIGKNGPNSVGTMDLIPHSSINHTCNLSVNVLLAAGDTIGYYLYQASGAALGTTGNADRSYGCVTKVG